MVVDGVENPEDYNHYKELALFTDHPRKIMLVEAGFNRIKMLPWVHEDGEGMTVTAVK